MSFDAGSAKATYTLDISQARQAAQELRGLFVGLRQEADRLNQQRGNGSPAAARQAAQSQQQVERAILARAAAEARLVQVQNTGKSALAGLTQAEKIYADALARVNQNSIAAVRAQTQLSVIQNRIAGQQGGGNPILPRTLESISGAAIAQVAGLAFGPQVLASVASFTVSAGKAALSLRETQNALRAVSGDAKTYENTLAIARQQQVLFGGSLEENIQGLTGLTITARQSGADLKALVDLSQRLAILDPSQGQGGARVAISEALSGDPTSLARRYEIPRAALAKLRDEGTTTAEKLQVIDTYLNNVGITSAAVAGKVDPAAKAYRELGAAADQAKNAFGGLIANGFAPLATAAAGVLGGGFSKDFKTGLVDGAIGVQNLLRSLQGLPPITGAAAEAQRGYADATFRGAQAVADALGITQLYTSVVGQATAAEVQADDVEQRRIGTLAALSAAQAAATQKLAETLQQKIQSTQETQKLNDAQTTLANIGAAVKAGLITAADGAVTLGIQFGFAKDEALKLINAQVAIAQTGRKGTDGSSAVGIISGYTQGVQAAKDLEAATARGILQNGTYAQKLALLNSQLKNLVPGTAAYIDKQNEIIALERSQVKGAAGTANQLANIARTSGDERLRIERENLERLRDQEAEYNIRRTRSQEDYERQRRRLLASGRIAEAKRLAEEYAIEQRRAQEDFSRQRGKTLRDNAERGADLVDKTENRILNATRGAGVRGGAAAIGGAAIPSAGPGGGGGGVLLRIQIAPTQLTVDGHTLVELTWPEIEQRIAGDLAVIGITVPPGSGQQAGVSGARP